MTQFKRRRPDPGYLPKDQAAWLRLIRLARQAARNPKFGPDLARAASAAVRAVIPPGHRTRDSVFMRLILKARLFWPATAEVQAGAAGELERLADACAEILAIPPPRDPRIRADLE